MLETTQSIKVCPAIRPNQVAQGFILSGLENLQGWRLHNFSGQTAPLLDCPHDEEDFPKSTLNLCRFNLSPLSLIIPPTIHPGEKPGSTILITSSYVLECGYYVPLKLSLLQAEQAPVPSASPHRHVLQLPTILLVLCWTHAYWPMSFCIGRPKTGCRILDLD